MAYIVFVIPGGVYHETCYCPESNGQIWEEAMKCPLNHSQIQRDLASFTQINLKELHREAVRQFGTHHALCHYSVINNQVCGKHYTCQQNRYWM